MQGTAKKILVTGSEGYIGSVLVAMLLEEGYDVTGLDTCFYAQGNLTGEPGYDYRLITKDIRDVTQDDLRGFDAIVHLAALSNDPLGELDETLTFEINCDATVRLGQLAKDSGVGRFVFSSSCSVYGQAENRLSEDGAVNPQTAYAKSKALAEEGLRGLASDAFSPVFLRSATAFGVCRRMRFDTVVNNLAGFAKTTGKVQILGDGRPWRPLVHVQDICRAFTAVLKADRQQVHNEVFNIGDSKENYRIKTIAEKVQQQFAGSQLFITQKDAAETRNYVVDFDKAKRRLGFTAGIRLQEGIAEIKKVYDRVGLDYQTFTNRLYNRVKQVKWLMENGIIDERLHWRKLAGQKHYEILSYPTGRSVDNRDRAIPGPARKVRPTVSPGGTKADSRRQVD